MTFETSQQSATHRLAAICLSRLQAVNTQATVVKQSTHNKVVCELRMPRLDHRKLEFLFSPSSGSSTSLQGDEEDAVKRRWRVNMVLGVQMVSQSCKACPLLYCYATVRRRLGILYYY